jgi:hypothetical protein
MLPYHSAAQRNLFVDTIMEDSRESQMPSFNEDKGSAISQNAQTLLRNPHILQQHNLVERIGETLDKLTDAVSQCNDIMKEIYIEGHETVLHCNIWESYFQNISHQLDEASNLPFSL